MTISTSLKKLFTTYLSSNPALLQDFLFQKVQASLLRLTKPHVSHLFRLQTTPSSQPARPAPDWASRASTRLHVRCLDMYCSYLLRQASLVAFSSLHSFFPFFVATCMGCEHYLAKGLILPRLCHVWSQSGRVWGRGGGEDGRNECTCIMLSKQASQSQSSTGTFRLG